MGVGAFLERGHLTPLRQRPPPHAASKKEQTDADLQRHSERSEAQRRICSKDVLDCTREGVEWPAGTPSTEPA